MRCLASPENVIQITNEKMRHQLVRVDLRGASDGLADAMNHGSGQLQHSRL